MTLADIDAIAAADLAAVARIHAASFDDAWTESVFRRILAMPGAFGLAARDGAALIGFAVGRIAGEECEILSLAVDPARRRAGTGARLLDAMIAAALARGARVVFLEAAEDNAAALRLYDSRGFVTVGRRPNYYELPAGGAVAALTMRRDLPVA
jgi:ribosomal-protein-alanine N-acetyltransferase